jgi:hypothetical protein
VAVQAASSPDIVSYLTNAGVFIGAVIATWVGLRKGIKSEPPAESRAVGLAGGVLMDNTSMLMLSSDIKDLKDAVNELRHAVTRHTDELRISNARSRR